MNIQLLNGKSQTLDLNCPALSFGDGVFETGYVYQGEIEFLQEHLQPIQFGASKLNLKFRIEDQKALIDQFASLVVEVGTPQVLLLLTKELFSRD